MITNNNISSVIVNNSSNTETVLNTTEVWKPVKGYEGLYEVSNHGRIRGLERIIVQKNGRTRRVEGKILTNTLSGNGYYSVCLSKDGKSYCFGVHVLVAHAFVPGYDKDNANEVNHKDENRLNNVPSNLEWCSRKYNLNYGSYKERMSQTLRNSNTIIKQYDLQGNLIAEYPSMKEASRQTGIDVSCISNNINGKIKRGYTGGYRFVG